MRILCLTSRYRYSPKAPRPLPLLYRLSFPPGLPDFFLLLYSSSSDIDIPIFMPLARLLEVYQRSKNFLEIF